KTGPNFLEIVPHTINISAWRGEKEFLSIPNLAPSKVGFRKAIYSIPQHEVAKGSGQSEWLLAKPITLLNLVAKKPSPSKPSGGVASILTVGLLSDIMFFLFKN